MSARRRRAALYAVGALIVAFFCAVLASSVEGDLHRTILIVLSVVWLAIAGSCVAGVLRTEAAPPPAVAEEPDAQP